MQSKTKSLSWHHVTSYRVVAFRDQLMAFKSHRMSLPRSCIISSCGPWTEKEQTSHPPSIAALQHLPSRPPLPAGKLLLECEQSHELKWKEGSRHRRADRTVGQTDITLDHNAPNTWSVPGSRTLSGAFPTLPVNVLRARTATTTTTTTVISTAAAVAVPNQPNRQQTCQRHGSVAIQATQKIPPSRLWSARNSTQRKTRQTAKAWHGRTHRLVRSLLVYSFASQQIRQQRPQAISEPCMFNRGAAQQAAPATAAGPVGFVECGVQESHHLLRRYAIILWRRRLLSKQRPIALWLPLLKSCCCRCWRCTRVP